MKLQRIAKILERQNDLKIRSIILDTAQKENQIIHGARAYNVQSPYYLRKKTADYDILTTKPKKSAQNVSKRLRRVLGKDVKVVQGQHKGTYKVKVNGRTVADYTQLKTKPKTYSSLGNKFRDIKSIKRDAQRLLKKVPYRKEKDLDTLQRIKQIEELDRRFSF